MSESQESLSRDMSLFDITMIGVGAMIGAGIFVLTGEAAGIAGPALILAFALNGLVSLLTAMVYAELGSAIPEAGGGYLWIKEGLPGANAFLAGWMSWFAHAVAGALYALGFGAFIFELLHIFHIPMWWIELLNIPLRPFGLEFSHLVLSKKLFGVVIALLFAYINFRGASETGLAGNIVTMAKITVIGIFCLFGLKFMFAPEAAFSLQALPGTSEAEGGMGFSQLRDFIPAETGWIGILSAMGLTFIAFEGYEIIVQAGEEVENPRENIPKAVFWSLAIVVPIYMLVAFVLIGGSSPDQLLDALRALGKSPEALGLVQEGTFPPSWQILGHVGELGLAKAARAFLPYGVIVVLAGGILSTMSALNATTFSSTRVAFAMGRDKNLPDGFGRIHSTTRTPYFALCWTAVLICFMVIFVPISTVAAAADIMFLLLFFQVNIAAITIRKKYGDKLAYGYLMPFFPLLPILAMTGMIVIAVSMAYHFGLAWIYALIWLAVGFGIYRFYARYRERAKDAPPVIAEEKALEVRPHSVLIAVADPEAAQQNIRLGARLARHRDSELVLLHVVRVPQQLPPSAAGDFVEDARPVLDRARDYAEQFDVPVTTLMRVGHRPAEAIIHTAQDKNTDYLIMGWKGTVHEEGSVIGRNIDRVLKEANTHAIVMQKGKPVEEQEIRRILVPIAKPQNAPLALGVASLLSEEAHDARITVLHLTPEPLDEDGKEEFREQIFEYAEEDEGGPQELFADPSRMELIFDVHSDPVGEIARRSKNYDRLILGTSEGGLLRRKVFGRIPTEIANRAQCPVVFVRPREPGVKFEVQHFFQFFRELEEMGQPEDAEPESPDHEPGTPKQEPESK